MPPTILSTPESLSMDWKQRFAIVRKPKSKREELVAARNELDIPKLQAGLDELVQAAPAPAGQR